MYEHDGAHELMWIEGPGSRHPPAQPGLRRWRRHGSIFINEELLASDLPLAGISASWCPNPTSPTEVGRIGGHKDLTSQTSSDDA